MECPKCRPKVLKNEEKEQQNRRCPEQAPCRITHAAALELFLLCPGEDRLAGKGDDAVMEERDVDVEGGGGDDIRSKILLKIFGCMNLLYF